MASLTPVQRATALGRSASTAPLRLVDGLTAPVRVTLTRDVRRAIGVTGKPPPPCTDPELAFLDPHGVARLVHSDLPTMLIGGLSALLLQALHPLAMAGVAEHSNYQSDPLGRLRRTAAFVGTTSFGTVLEAEKAIAQVQRVHRRVKGVAPDGRAYDAADPELVTFIHVAEMSSFLESARRFGPRPLTPDQCDQYYSEVAPVALALGANWVPRSTLEVESYFGRIRPELYAGPQARQARDWLRRGVATRPEERAVYSILLAAAVGTLPGWARRELGLSAPLSLDLLLDTTTVIPATRALSATLRWITSASHGALRQVAPGQVAPGQVAEGQVAPGQVAMDSPPSTPTT
jgi:uncharacterized protein (DUF2236 family)